MSSEPAISPTPEPAERELPPLKIVHLLALMVVVAVLLVIVDYKSLAASRVGGETSALMLVGWLIKAIPLTVTCFGIRWLLSGLRYFTQPGQFLAAVRACGLVSTLSIFLAVAHAPEYPGEWTIVDHIRWYTLSGLSGLGGVTVFVLLIFALRQDFSRGWWKTYFVVNLCSHMLAGVNQIFHAFLIQYVPLTEVFWLTGMLHMFCWGIPTGIHSVLLVLLIGRGWKERRTYHWSHWVGVVLSAVLALFGFGWFLWSFW